MSNPLLLKYESRWPIVYVSTMASMLISTLVMLGTAKFLLVLLSFSCHTDYMAAECGQCQRELDGGLGCLDIDLDIREPVCLGCTTTKFYEVKFDTPPAICPPCAKANDEDKICKPDAQLINSVSFCKKCLEPTTTTTSTTTVQRDEQSSGDAASVCLLGHLFLLPIVNLILVWKQAEAEVVPSSSLV